MHHSFSKGDSRRQKADETKKEHLSGGVSVTSCKHLQLQVSAEDIQVLKYRWCRKSINLVTI